ncbi:MAG: HAD hydrolase family protein, partial [Eubacterium sp.]|nr:HAD hydrolase family protein [Eubacterium sp.]
MILYGCRKRSVKCKKQRRNDMKTLYVTDLDGTLMRNDMKISDESVRILNQLIDKGVLITYATARSFHSSYDIT